MWQKIKNIYHLLVAVVAVIYYRFPGRSIKIIGVTGTDGKTTTTSLIAHILKNSGKKVSYITTVSANIGNKLYETGFHTTTPSSFSIQRYLRLAVDNGDEYFVLETTSHALDQYRVFGVPYLYGVITNITHEHLQYHKTFENYIKAKCRLANMAKIVFINIDDDAFSKTLGNIKNQVKKYTFGFSHKADFSIKISDKIGKRLTSFNELNYLCAYAVCKTIDIKDNEIFRAMKTFSLPEGRMEVVYDGKFKVIIDFAHTPNSVNSVLSSVRKIYEKSLVAGRLIHVFGAAAFRDDSKRPKMGAASGLYSDLVILTEEDYRTENPLKISNMIAEGLKSKGFEYSHPEEFGKEAKRYSIITNRQEAIIMACKIAKPDDVIILTGKGHEKSLCRGNIEYPWDEKAAVKKGLSLISD
jgi:UDP-N-acetylmuramoyl-L-alanyl-D-glutamate--2,6-diaminopimelate ligase